MVATARTQKRYDHRLRELVRTTQDMSLALQHGVPRSTARGWLTAPNVEVVTADALNMDAVQRQEEGELFRQFQQSPEREAGDLDRGVVVV